MAAGAAVQPRGPVPLLAGGVVHPLARGRVRRPRVHRCRRRHAAGRLRARPSSPTRASARRSTPSSRARTASSCATATPSGREGVVAARRVHPDGAVRAPATHGDRAASTSSKWFDRPERVLRPRPQDLHAVQPPVVGRGLRHHPRGHCHGPRDPERGLHAGGPGPGDRQGRDHRVLRLGAGLHGVLACSTSASGSPRRSRTWPRSIPRRARRSSSASRTTGRSTATAAASGRCSGRSR